MRICIWKKVSSTSKITSLHQETNYCYLYEYKIYDYKDNLVMIFSREKIFNIFKKSYSIKMDDQESGLLYFPRNIHSLQDENHCHRLNFKPSNTTCPLSIGWRMTLMWKHNFCELTFSNFWCHRRKILVLLAKLPLGIVLCEVCSLLTGEMGL